MIPTLISKDTTYYGDGESWLNSWKFHHLTEEQAKAVIAYYGLERSGGQRAGSMFMNDASVHHEGRFTIIKQRGGYDI